MDPVLFKPLEELLDRGIAASIDAQRLCSDLEDRTMELAFQGLPATIRLGVRDGRLLFVESDEKPADCSIDGMPISMIQLAVSGDQDKLRSGAVTLAGDPALARDFQRLLELARPDWEEELSRVVGDVAARQLGNLARGVLEWGRGAAETFSKNAGEYLQEESRDLPTRFEVDEFLDDVDRINTDMDRAEARIARLERNRQETA